MRVVLLAIVLSLAGCATPELASCKVEYYKEKAAPTVENRLALDQCCAGSGYFDHDHCYGGH